MANGRTIRFRAGSAAALAGLALIAAGCGSSSSSSSTPAPAPSSSSGSSSGSGASGTALSIGTAKGPDGTYLTGPSGRALYLWVADSHDKSVCSGACAQVWPPLTATSMPTAGTGVNATDIGTITRSDGAKQVTYKGQPLYYYVTDKAAGNITGQGSDSFGAKWWLVAPSGSAITASGSSGSASGGGSTSGY
jgi:predicted lipoprotein with Yx(FWY)xxD motif